VFNQEEGIELMSINILVVVDEQSTVNEKKKNYLAVSILTADPQDTKKNILLCQDAL